MDTKVVEFSKETLDCKMPNIQYQILMRKTAPKNWHTVQELKERFSGTLIKAHRHNFKTGGHTKHEAIAQTMGYMFEVVPSSRVTFNDAISEGDCHAVTESLWFFDRLVAINPFPEDKFEIKYIMITEENDNVREGIGVIVKETSIQWIGESNILLAIIAEYNKAKGDYEDPINPF